MALQLMLEITVSHQTFSNHITVEPRFNEVPTNWENCFVKLRVRDIEVHFSYILL